MFYDFTSMVGCGFSVEIKHTKKEEEKALNLLIFPFTKEQENYGK